MSQYTDLIARLEYLSPWDPAIREAAVALEALQAEQDAIDALHQPGPEGDCRSCWDHDGWPCPTHRILHPGEPT